MKPPSATPYTALRIGQLAIEAGMPGGLLNIVPGDAEAGEALIRHCLLVEAPIYDDVVSSLSQLVAQFRIGRAIDRTTTFGPVIDARARDRILGVIERAAGEGEGRLVAGGRRVGGALADGYFMEPTIFADVQPGSRLAREEIFGPVLSVIRFETEDEAVALANDSELGLGTDGQPGSRASPCSAARGGLCEHQRVFQHGPAAPFGGYKQSGFGRFGGLTGLHEYLQTKTVFIAPGPGERR